MRISIGHHCISPADESPKHWFARWLPRAVALAALMLASLASAPAQGIEVVGTRFVHANVSTESGRFWISTGPAFGNYRFLYGNDFFITSNIIFRVTTGGADRYYSNIPLDYPYRPVVGLDTEAEYSPVDYVRSGDTLSLKWSGLSGYTVMLRFMPEKENNEFDQGGDMLLEFTYTLDPFAPPATLGIFMMLDSYNSQAGGVDGESSILTSDHYFEVGKPGKLYAPVPDSIPEFYQVGNFRYEQPLNTVLAIHRLKGLSHGGTPLTPPNTFAVSDWAEVLRDNYWGLNGPRIEITPLGDCATASRWEGLQGSGVLRTAFGVNDREGNNLFHMRDSAMFVDVRTARIVEQKTPAGAYLPAQFDLDMWVANLDVNLPANVSIRMDSIAPADGLVRDAATPAVQSAVIPAGGTAHLQWKLSMPPGRHIARADVPINFLYNLGDGVWHPFRDATAPVITIKGFRAPNEDTLAPVITLTASQDTPVKRWSYSAADRHAGYPDDSGIDTVRPVPNRNRNVRIAPDGSYTRCSVAADMHFNATVIDPQQPAALVVAVYDCKGNVAYDSAFYTPPTLDTLPPVMMRIDSSAGRWVFRAFDRHTNYLYDSGLDRIGIEVATVDNFTLETTVFDRCDTTQDVSITAIVTDTSRRGKVVFEVFDCRGNSVRDSVIYQHTPAGVADDNAVAGRRRLAILTVRPQPLTRSSGRTLDVRIDGLRGGISHADLISSDGRLAARFEIEGGNGAITDRTLRLPADIPAGVYVLRVVGNMGATSAKVVVIE